MSLPEPNERFTRRQLALATLTGAVAGGAWGAAIQALAKPSSPSLSLVGKGNSQVALIDTTRVRVLILLGPANADPIEIVPAMLTLVRQRLDIVIGSSTAIERLPAGFLSHWRTAHQFAIPTSDSPSPGSRLQTPVIEDYVIDLGDDAKLEIHRSTRDAWDTAKATQHLWLVTARFGSASLLLAPDSQSADVLAERGASLLAVPGGDAGHMSRLLSPASLAMNANDGLSPLPGMPLVRIFPTDIARFTIKGGHVALPSWTVTVT